MFYGRQNFEKMTERSSEYTEGVNGNFEIALSVKNFDAVDSLCRNYCKGRAGCDGANDRVVGATHLLHCGPRREPH